jgi:hypothetical protein
MAYYGAIAAAAAEKKRQQQLHTEEENMTRYTQEDLKGDWEFKIGRSESGAFREPEVLEKLIEEETRAGWVLLEKFDDSRVRFKRPRSARARDGFLPEGVDPYRTRYGAPSARYAVLTSVSIGLLVLGLGVFGYSLMDGTDAPMTSIGIMAMPLILILLGFMVVIWKIRRIR